MKSQANRPSVSVFRHRHTHDRAPFLIHLKVLQHSSFSYNSWLSKLGSCRFSTVFLYYLLIYDNFLPINISSVFLIGMFHMWYYIQVSSNGFNHLVFYIHLIIFICIYLDVFNISDAKHLCTCHSLFISHKLNFHFPIWKNTVDLWKYNCIQAWRNSSDKK